MSTEKKHAIKDDRWHILNRPGMYIGGISEGVFPEYLIENGNMELVDVVIVPGLLKTINEVIDNANDVLYTSKGGKIKVKINEYSVTVEDNGPGMPIKFIKDLDGSDIMLPRAMWGKAKAGSNFSGDSSDSTTIGTNGVGSYCANVWSKTFVGKSINNNKQFIGTWTDNDSNYKEEIKDADPSLSTGCEVYFEPDLERFNVTEISDFHLDVIEQRLVNLSFLFPNIDYYLNDKLIKYDKKKYISAFCKVEGEYEIIELDNYTIAVLPSRTDSFETFSIMNGLNIKSGGTHIDMISKEVVKGIKNTLPKKLIYSRDENPSGIKDGDIKNKLQILVFGKNFPEIQWEGQTKEKIGNSDFAVQMYFGQAWKKILPKIAKNKTIIESITFLHAAKIVAEEKKAKALANKDLKKNKALKLRDAINEYKYLAITEGDSALNGIIDALGRSIIGFLPLKGVPLNVFNDNHSIQKILANVEFKDIMTALNLTFSENVGLKGLKYENIVMMMDADQDGSHIQGIIMGFLYRFKPELFKKGKVYRFLTPIKVAKNKKEKMIYAFLNEAEYEKAGKDGLLDGLIIEHKKGLGSLSDEEYKEFFNLRNFDECLERVLVPDNDFSLLKQWLQDDTDFRKAQILKKDVSIKNTINKKDNVKEIELNNFLDTFYKDWAKYRAFQRIPFFVDLFAESQRKIIHTFLDKNIVKKINVDDASSMVKMYTNYHHGATSLESTISNLVPKFNNNLQLLSPDGSFGKRSSRKPSAPRYVFTKLMPYTKLLFPKIDNLFFNEQWNDSKKIEPQTLFPILPIGLINGQSQIGVGWSCNVLPRDPLKILNLIKDILTGKIKEIPKEIPITLPCFKGLIFKNPKGGYQIQGIIKEKNDGKGTKKKYLHISEVPIKYSRQVDVKKNSDGTEKRSESGYINVLENLIEDKIIKSYNENINGDNFDIKVYGFDYSKLPENDIERQGVLIKTFKLLENKSDNISIINSNDSIEQIDGIGVILMMYIKFRLNIYVKRKNYLSLKLSKDLYRLQSKIEFIKAFNDEKITIKNMSNEDIIKALENYEYKFLKDNEKIQVNGVNDENDNNIIEDDNDIIDNNPYQYLLNMKIQSLTLSNVVKFEKNMINIQKELDTINSTTAANLWLKDLQEFENAYLKFLS